MDLRVCASLRPKVTEGFILGAARVKGSAEPGIHPKQRMIEHPTTPGSAAILAARGNWEKRVTG
jgi:hypothetical protein